MARRTFGTVRKRSSGRWQAFYIYDGQRYPAPRVFSSRAAAAGWLSEIEASIRRGSWIDPKAGEITVTDLAEKWWNSNPHKRPTTAATDGNALKNHILPRLGDRAIASVNQEEIQEAVNSWSRLGRTRRDEPLEPRTVHRVYGVLKAVFNYGVKTDRITRSPCRDVKLPKVEGTRRKHLSDAEFATIAEAFPEEYRLMVYIGGVTALRISEVFGLTVGAIDLSGNQLSVVLAVTRDRSGKAVIGPPKSLASRRTVPISPELTGLIAEHMSIRGLTPEDSGAFLFVSPEGGPLNYNNWRDRVWLPALERARCEGAGFHDLRRKAASIMVTEGVDVKTAQEIMGHSDPRLTLAVYASSTSEAQQRAAKAIGDRILPRRPQA